MDTPNKLTDTRLTVAKRQTEQTKTKTKPTKPTKNKTNKQTKTTTNCTLISLLLKTNDDKKCTTKNDASHKTSNLTFFSLKIQKQTKQITSICLTFHY